MCRSLRIPTVALAFTLLATEVAADRLVTSDGRILEVKRARKLEDGTYELTFENGTIRCSAEHVLSVEIEGDMSDYVPSNEDERKKLERGYVRYRGKWMSRPAYETQLKREAKASRERVEELAAHADFYNGYQTETKHFKLTTNTSPELLDYYAELMESYYSLMDDRVGIKPTPTLRRTKMNINIFKSAEDYYATTNMPRGAVGYFYSVDKSLNFFHDYDDPAFTTWVALHECTHLLTYLIDPQAQPLIWVNEGIADFFGSSTVEVDERGKIEITPGALQVDRILTVQQAVRDGDYVPLETLFRTTRQEFDAFEYAHSWSFVYFLNNNSEYEKGFKDFFEDFYTIPKSVDYEWYGQWKVIQPEEVRRILLESLRVDDVEELQTEWIEYVMSIDIDAPEALFKRAYRAVRQGDTARFKNAAADLDAAIEAGFDDPRAYWARGLVASYNKGAGIKVGIPDLRKAVEMAPLNALYRYSLAEALGGFQLSIGGSSIIVDDGKQTLLFGTPEQFDEGKSQLGLACELAPDNDFYRERFDEYARRLANYVPASD